MKIIEEPKQNGIPILEMKDGDIAVITDWDSWDSRDYHIGKIVQRYGDALIPVGMPSGCGWGIHNIKGGLHMHRVRILTKGTKLEI